MKSAKIKIIITSVLLIILICAVAMLGIYPEAIEFTQTQKELSQERTALESAEFKLSELNKLHKDQANVQTTKEFINDLMPDNKNSSDFVVKTESLANGLSVIIDNFTTTSAESTNKKPAATAGDSQAKAKTTESSVDYSITMNEGYSTAYEVVKKLESFPRFNVIDALYFSNFSTETNTLDFRALGRIFYGK